MADLRLARLAIGGADECPVPDSLPAQGGGLSARSPDYYDHRRTQAGATPKLGAEETTDDNQKHVNTPLPSLGPASAFNSGELGNGLQSRPGEFAGRNFLETFDASPRAHLVGHNAAHTTRRAISEDAAYSPPLPPVHSPWLAGTTLELTGPLARGLQRTRGMSRFRSGRTTSTES